ncbi:hypothetical protein BGY98DRAFT_982844 [Russula aff. rugulosa BPL654]|jgi:hypothetical protein|nr:hypothetical protein BGY98DRAFT_982844 [Russula aff. rugulosa BPL654]
MGPNPWSFSDHMLGFCALRMSLLGVLAKSETDIILLPLDHLTDMNALNNDDLRPFHRMWCREISLFGRKRAIKW